MSKASRNRAPRKKAGRAFTLVKWAAAAAAIGLVVYAVSQMSGVAFTDQDIKVVDFSNLTAKGKRTALQAANEARCPCGCSLGLAQCVATDSTCPIREQNIDRIKQMVRNAEQQ